jgi:hypothetical protein
MTMDMILSADGLTEQINDITGYLLYDAVWAMCKR